jgi:erythromycin esterase-like protein
VLFFQLGRPSPFGGEKQQQMKEKQKMDEKLSALIANAAEPLPDVNDPTFGEYFDRFADRRVVLLGEARQGFFL